MSIRNRDIANIEPHSFAERVMPAVLAAGLLVIPAIFSNGTDTFRLPKEVVFRAEAILLLMLAVFWVTSRRRTWTFGKRPELILAAAFVCWTIVTTAASTNRLLSIDSLITVVAAAVIFIATCLAAQTVTLVAVDVLMIGCCANAVIVILQELKIWTPFLASRDTATHYGSVALLGNANDVGTYLVGPAVAAVVLTATVSGRRRWIYAAISVLLVAGIAASGTRTALGALVAGMVVFAIGHSRRAALAVAAILVGLALVVMSPATTLGRGIRQLVTAAAHHDYRHLSSERLLPFLTAVDMTRDHPLLGVGPGCFKYHYMAYRVGLSREYPREWTQGFPMNWGEVHNDHLQVAAETGLPGYALFLAAIGVCVVRRRRDGATTPEAAFAWALRWPLATVIFVICLAQFPLELAAPRLMFLTLGALCVTWGVGRRGSGVGEESSIRDAAPTPDTQHPTPARFLSGAIALVALIAAAIGIDQLCIEPYRDNLTMRVVRQRSAQAESFDQMRAASLARTNLHDLDLVARERRLDPEWYLLYGGNCEILGRWTEAADAYTRALAIDDRPEIYVNRGLLMLRMGRTDAAVADLATAARFDPRVASGLDGELRVRVAAAAGLR
ncbi:MAG TPA: O-antigen ligase family protein [Thermoanaerobaculia bacterium]|nr:O-antigen ligase family protein [Thermoanaerobaculia bacterium]